jgi:hypothetical protein
MSKFKKPYPPAERASRAIASHLLDLGFNANWVFLTKPPIALLSIFGGLVKNTQERRADEAGSPWVRKVVALAWVPASNIKGGF